MDIPISMICLNLNTRHYFNNLTATGRKGLTMNLHEIKKALEDGKPVFENT